MSADVRSLDMNRLDRTSYRPIRTLGLLLILQVIGLAAIGVYEFVRADWDTVVVERSISPPELSVQTDSEQTGEAIVYVAFFLLPALLMLLASVGFFLLERRGWLLAAIAQGLSLGICLFLYTELDPGYIFPIMGYCVLMILYLNTRAVRMVFHSRRASTQSAAKAQKDN